MSQLRTLPEPSSLVGLLALVPLQSSPQTEDTSLTLHSSLTLCSFLVPSASTFYQSIANGLVERLHCQLVVSLKAQPDPTNWTVSQPMVLLAIPAIIKEDIHCTPAELMLWYTISQPGQCIFLKHWAYFIHTAPQVYCAAASCSICLSSSSHCSDS